MFFFNSLCVLDLTLSAHLCVCVCVCVHSEYACMYVYMHIPTDVGYILGIFSSATKDKGGLFNVCCLTGVEL